MLICIVLISVYLNVKNENVKYQHTQPHTPSAVQSDDITHHATFRKI